MHHIFFQGFEVPAKEEELTGTEELCPGRMGSIILRTFMKLSCK